MNYKLTIANPNDGELDSEFARTRCFRKFTNLIKAIEEERLYWGNGPARVFYTDDHRIVPPAITTTWLEGHSYITIAIEVINKNEDVEFEDAA